MNCFAHALPFLDKPLIAIGASLPDWMAAADRKARLRQKRAAMFTDEEEPTLAGISAGVVQHHQDDYWFHKSPAFRDYEMKFAIEIRDLYGSDQSLRSGFVAHVLIEMFLDDWLARRYPGKLEQYYDLVAAADAKAIQQTINVFATRPTTKLVRAMEVFLRERYIFDYATDAGAVKRMNGVLRRIGLDELDDAILPWAATARVRVEDRAFDLLHGYAMDLDIPTMDFDKPN